LGALLGLESSHKPALIGLVRDDNRTVIAALSNGSKRIKTQSILLKVWPVAPITALSEDGPNLLRENRR
jgi:hypothetical protein